MEQVTTSAVAPYPAVRQQPRHARAVDRIEAILAATEEAVAEGNINDLSVLDIARRAGIKAPSIYYHFKGIEDILTLLIGRHMSDYQSRVDALLDAADSADALVDAYLETGRLAFAVYSGTPVIRGLWAATRYLPILRGIDEQHNVYLARKFGARLGKLNPGCNRAAVFHAVLMSASLSLAAFETVLSRPARERKSLLEAYFSMARAILDPFRAQVAQP